MASSASRSVNARLSGRPRRRARRCARAPRRAIARTRLHPTPPFATSCRPSSRPSPRPDAPRRVCVAGRHGRDVGGDQQDESRRCRARAGRTDEHDNRRARRDHSRHDAARRIEQAARRPQHEDDELRAGRVGRVDRVDEVFGGDRLDDAVDLRDDDLASRRCRLRPRRLDDAAERDRRSNERQARHGGPIVRRAYRPRRAFHPRAVDLELLHCARFPPNFRRATC